MNILIVDDEPQVRLLLRKVLQDAGHDVFDAAEGQEALDKMARVKVDMIISDVYMPVMDGVKLHRTVRGIPGYETLPFLFLSAFDDEHTREAVNNPQYEAFLQKAKPVELLLRWVEYLGTPPNKRSGPPPIEFPSRSRRGGIGS